MKTGFKVIVSTLILITAGISTSVYAAPQLTMQEEEAANPNIVKAIRAMEIAYKDLESAPHDFGGNKGAAMNDTKAAIHSLKKALYYRLNMDDAAIDRAQSQ